MSAPADISPAIIEALYHEALDLADEARTAFDLPEEAGSGDAAARSSRIAHSCEALRTTTRMMHALAWLLNHRAYHNGEISEFALRRHGRLPAAQQDSDPGHLSLLDHDLRALVERTRHFYARLGRLDDAWRSKFALQPSAVHRLRERIGASLQSA